MMRHVSCLRISEECFAIYNIHNNSLAPGSVVSDPYFTLCIITAYKL